MQSGVQTGRTQRESASRSTEYPHPRTLTPTHRFKIKPPRLEHRDSCELSLSASRSSPAVAVATVYSAALAHLFAAWGPNQPGAMASASPVAWAERRDGFAPSTFFESTVGEREGTGERSLDEGFLRPLWEGQLVVGAGQAQQRDGRPLGRWEHISAFLMLEPEAYRLAYAGWAGHGR
jgi:hypothetical protein